MAVMVTGKLVGANDAGSACRVPEGKTASACRLYWYFESTVKNANRDSGYSSGT